MLPPRHIWVSSAHLHLFYFPLFLVYKAVPQREQTPLFRQSELSFWQWYAIPRCRRRLKQNLTKSLTEDFPNIPISFPFPISRHSLKKFIGMLQPVVCFMNSIHRISTSSRWEPLAPLGRTLSLSNDWWTDKLTSLCLVKRRRSSVDRRWSLQRLSYPRQIYDDPQPMVIAISSLQFQSFLISQTITP